MPLLCAENNSSSLLLHHLSAMASAPRSEPSLLAFAHHLAQQQQQQQGKLPSPPDSLSIDPSQLYVPWPPPRSDDPSALPPLQHLPQHSLGFSPADAADGAGDLADLLLRGGSTGELDMTAEWMLMDCLMCDMDGGAIAMADCFEPNPCESSTQSSEPVAMAAGPGVAATSGYPCTPLEEALPDGFTVLEEAQRCIIDEAAWEQRKNQHHRHQAHNLQEQNHDAAVAQVLHLQEDEDDEEEEEEEEEGEEAMQAEAMSSGATSTRSPPYAGGERRRGREPEPEPSVCVSSQGIHLMQMLLECAKTLDRDPDRALILLSALKRQASKEGDPIQRLAAYFSDALCRTLRRNAGKSAPAATVTEQEWLMAHKAMRDTCPFDTFADLTIDQTILESVAEASPPPSARIHIVDFSIGYGVQWAALLQCIADSASLSRNVVQITGVRMPGGAEHRFPVGGWLTEFGRSAGVRVHFTAAEAEIGSIGVEGGDVVVVNLMHAMSAAMERDGEEGVEKLLGLVGEMRPKLVMVAEMEAAGGAAAEGAAFEGRFVEALHFYSAMFDAVEAAMGREKERRALVEAVVLGRGIEGAVAAGGGGGGGEKWRRRRLQEAGLAPRRLSSYARSQARILLWRFAEGFCLRNDVDNDEDGSRVTLAWQSTRLLTVSAWAPAGYHNQP